MKYSYSALVLATFAVTQAVAGPVKHAHDHLHKRHGAVLEVKAEEKRDWVGVNFATVSITTTQGQTYGEPTKVVVAAAAAVKTAPAEAPAKATSATSTTPVEVTTSASSTKAAATTDTTQDTILTDTDKARLASLGAKIGTNSLSDNGNIWIGAGGPFTFTLHNNAGQDLIIVAWGKLGSWVNVITPFISHSISAGSSVTLSLASGVSGGFTAVYPDTQLVMGQLSNTWGEFTTGAITVYDVSREVNMDGHDLSLVGPSCTSDMDTCVFKCPGSLKVCTFGYVLENCGPGSQAGAEYGLDFGAPSGGCRLQGTHMDATFS